MRKVPKFCLLVNIFNFFCAKKTLFQTLMTQDAMKVNKSLHLLLVINPILKKSYRFRKVCANNVKLRYGMN